MQKKAIVIGAGLAGLASAIRLAHRGIEVHIFENNSFPGGKINSKSHKGFRFDQGPSLFTCPEYLEELYQLCGKDFSTFKTIPYTESFNYFYEDGECIQLFKEKEKVVKELSEKLGESSIQVEKYLTKAEKNYRLIAPLFIEKSLHRWWTLFGGQLSKALLHLPSYKLFSTMHQENERFFRNPRTQQIFNRFAQYNGSHPYRAPAMLNMISHLEINERPVLPLNGMVQISDSLFELAKQLGVQFHFEERVNKIIVEQKTIKGILTDKGEYKSDFVLSNMDVSLTYRQLLKNEKHPTKTLNQEKSSSAIVFYFGIKKEFSQLHTHNMLFSDNDKEEFDIVFDEKKIHSTPSLYLYISSKSNPKDAPKGMENWFILLNAPINTGQNWEEIVTEKRKYVLAKMSRLVGENIEPLIVTEDSLNPSIVEAKYLAEQGSIYGNASNNRFAAFNRHPNFSKKIKGLYFAGVSVHPGGGIPLAFNSAKIACECLFSDFKIE